MVLGLGAKIGIAAAVPVAMAGLGVGGFFFADGTLEAELIGKDCFGNYDPADQATWIKDSNQQSTLTVEIKAFGMEQSIPNFQNNMCYMLDIGDVGKFHVASKDISIHGADGFCKYDSTSDKPIAQTTDGRYSNC